MDRTDGAVLEALGVHPDRADLTVVQFSTAFCGPCRGPVPGLRPRPEAHREPASGEEDGVLSRAVGRTGSSQDAESHLDAVRALGVDRTPTLLHLDREGRLVRRSSGAPRPAELAAVVDAHVPAAASRAGRGV